MLLSGNFFTAEYWMTVLYSIPAILIGLSFHEFAHAYSAYKLGDNTARLQGRMTVDPSKHIDFFGLICLLFCGFGWAKPVPVNFSNLKHKKRNGVVISIAGILMNLLIAFASYGIYFAVISAGFNNAVFINIMEPIIVINVSLAVFNILPIPPLDGYRILYVLFVSKSGKIFYFLEKYGFIILLVLVFTGIISILLSSLVDPILQLFYNFFSLFV